MNSVWLSMRGNRKLEFVNHRRGSNIVTNSPINDERTCLATYGVRVWRMTSICLKASWVAKPLKALWITGNSPSSDPFSISLSWSFKYNPLSPPSFSSFSFLKEAWYSADEKTPLFRHSDAICPRPWHLKHLLQSSNFGGNFKGVTRAVVGLKRGGELFEV